jgi:DNA-binding NarL/FixJ family response regulator
MSSPPRVLIADADAPTRVGLRVSLSGAGFHVAAEATAADEAVHWALSGPVDLALVATDLPGGGLDAARRISGRLPGTRVVALTARPSGEELVAAVLAGASGYLGKDIRGARLPQALRAVLDGEVALPRRLTHHLLEELRGRDVRRALVAARTDATLTDREWEVLQMLAGDVSTAEMAQRIRISEVTVRRHISSLLGKLRVRNRAEAAALLRSPS